jgi:tetraacyldisaccharide 4'-kinase
MGGRGKTPVVALVARMLLEAGEKPAILSRGYKRRQPEDGVVIVSDGVRMLADLDRSGDEPLMLARKVPGAAVLVSEVRATAAALAEGVVGATAHVLDDGFQHQSLGRDIDIVLLTATDLRDRRLPFGRLRSPVTALRSADAVIFDGPADQTVIAEARQHLRAGVPVFSLSRHLGSAVWLDGSGAALSRESPVLALSGIAHPARFVSSLRDAGFNVAAELSFADHHHYGRRDVMRIADSARACHAVAVLTTEKDAVRLLPWRPLPVAVAAVPLDALVEPADEFKAWLFAALVRVRECL